MAFESINIGNETYGIDENNGNPLTFTLNATVNGVITSYDIAWSDTYQLMGANIYSVNVGF